MEPLTNLSSVDELNPHSVKGSNEYFAWRGEQYVTVSVPLAVLPRQ